ncbi:unnamed protein product, partial [Discosporangium mesarthrocarpum]
MSRDAWCLLLEGVKEHSLKQELYLLDSPAEAWEHLYQKFSATTAEEQYSLTIQFRNATLTPGGDPLKFMGKLRNIASRLGEVGSSIPHNFILAEVLHSLGPDYDAECRSIRT